MWFLEKIAQILSHPKGLKRVLIIKLIAVIALIAVYRDEIFIGERTSEAETEKPSDLAKGGENAKKPATESKATQPKDEPAAKPEEAAAPTEKRKSFLDNLLNLPALSTDGMKKETLGRYMNLAEKKKEQIEGRLNLLRSRESQLVTIEKSIDEKLKKLEEERRFFVQTVQQEKDLKGKRLDKLIELYGKMEARKAAPIIEKLDKDLVVELFKNIDKKQAKSILEAMDAQKSAEFTEYFGRVRSAREYDLLRELNVSLRKEFQDCRGMPSGEREDSPLRNTGAPAGTQQGATSPQGKPPGTEASSAAAPTGDGSPATSGAAGAENAQAAKSEGGENKAETPKGAAAEEPQKVADASGAPSGDKSAEKSGNPNTDAGANSSGASAVPASASGTQPAGTSAR